MNENQYLAQLEKIYRTEGIDCSIMDPVEEFPQPRLLLFIGNDYLNRERILEVTLQVQELGQALADKKHADMQFLRVQFRYAFPFKVGEFAAPQVASLIAFLNHLLELPGFEMNEVDDLLSYRYVLLTGEKHLNPTLCLSILGLIMLLLQLFTETVEQVASGKKSFNDLLEDVIKISKNIEKSIPK